MRACVAHAFDKGSAPLEVDTMMSQIRSNSCARTLFSALEFSLCHHAETVIGWDDSWVSCIGKKNYIKKKKGKKITRSFINSAPLSLLLCESSPLFPKIYWIQNLIREPFSAIHYSPLKIAFIQRWHFEAFQMTS